MTRAVECKRCAKYAEVAQEIRKELQTITRNPNWTFRDLPNTLAARAKRVARSWREHAAEAHQ